MIVTQAEIDTARHWLASIAEDYRSEIPRRIHGGTKGQHYGLGAAPPFAPEFIKYIGGLRCERKNCSICSEQPWKEDNYRNPESRTRVTRAFRRLRRVAPLEFDVTYMATMHGLTASQIAEELNRRAITRGHPERYDTEAVAVLAVLGVGKLQLWY
jgi:hypothetical protein